MIISSLALVLAAAMPVAPLSNPIHLHPRVDVQDDRIVVHIVNPTLNFRDVKIGDHTYTVLSHQSINVKAPVGTIVYSASPGFTHKRGDILFQIAPDQNKTRIRLD